MRINNMTEVSDNERKELKYEKNVRLKQVYEQRSILFKSFFEHYGITGVFTDSYEEFIANVRRILERLEIKTKNGKVIFKDVIFNTPPLEGEPLYPRFARLISKELSSPLIVTMTLLEKKKETKGVKSSKGKKLVIAPSTKVEEKVKILTSGSSQKEEKKEEILEVIEVAENQDIGRLPVQVGSAYDVSAAINKPDPTKVDKFDPPGYFIGEKGLEKVIMTKVRSATDKIITYEKKEKQNKKYIESQINILNFNGINSRIVIRMTKLDKKKIFPYITIETNCLKIRSKSTAKRANINMFIIFNVLGYKDVNQVENMIVAWGRSSDEPKLRNRLANTRFHYETQEIDNYENYISASAEKPKKCKDDLINNIKKQILTDPNDPVMVERSIATLTFLIYRFIATEEKIIQADDRSDMANKRLEIAGHHLTQLFKNVIQNVKTSLETEFSAKDKNVSDPLTKVREELNKKITNTFAQSLSGNWGVVGAREPQENMVQLLSRLSISGAISHIRRVIIPLFKESTSTEAKMMTTSAKGYICPIETPDGKECGAINQMARTTLISKYRDLTNVEKFIMKSDKFMDIKQVNEELKYPYIVIYGDDIIGRATSNFRAALNASDNFSKNETSEENIALQLNNKIYGYGNERLVDEISEMKGFLNTKKTSVEYNIPIFLGSLLIGKCKKELRDDLVARRRQGKIAEDISIYFYEEYPGAYELIISRTPDRAIRPLIILYENELPLNETKT